MINETTDVLNANDHGEQSFIVIKHISLRGLQPDTSITVQEHSKPSEVQDLLKRRSTTNKPLITKRLYLQLPRANLGRTHRRTEVYNDNVKFTQTIKGYYCNRI